jgi:hypothetical protein
MKAVLRHTPLSQVLLQRPHGEYSSSQFRGVTASVTKKDINVVYTALSTTGSYALTRIVLLPPSPERSSGTVYRIMAMADPSACSTIRSVTMASFVEVALSMSILLLPNIPVMLAV